MDSTQEKLLEAAGEVFAEKGYEAATVREICRRADVANLAAVNYYFGDKEQLYVAAVKQAFGCALEQDAEPGWPEGTPPDEKLRDFIAGMARTLLHDKPRWTLQLMGRELSQPSSACAAFVRDFVEPRFRTLLGVLAEVLPAGTSAEDRHLTALSIVGQVVHHRCARAIITHLVGEDEVATYTADRLARHIADFTLAALGLGRPLPERHMP